MDDSVTDVPKRLEFLGGQWFVDHGVHWTVAYNGVQ